TSCAGIKQTQRDDIVVMELAPGSRVAGVFTKSSFKAAPVRVCEQHLRTAAPRAILINSGNANAATGDAGIEDALQCWRWVGVSLGADEGAVLPFSTGVIGPRLPLDKFARAIPDACSRLDRGWDAAARAIMTTDTGPKALSKSLDIDGSRISIT